MFQGALTKATAEAQESSQRSFPRGSPRSSRGALPEVQERTCCETRIASKTYGFFIGFITKAKTCDSKNLKRARGIGTKHSLTSLKSKHAFVDHLHPRSPCPRCLQTKKALSHPLRGASLRSAPHSSRKEYHVFPLCLHYLPRLYLAWPKRCSRELSQKPPQKPMRAPRKSPPEVPRGAPEGPSQSVQKGTCFGTPVGTKACGFFIGFTTKVETCAIMERESRKMQEAGN